MHEKTLKDKVIYSLRTGDFVYKVKRRLHSYIPVFWVKNRNLQFKIYVCKTYDRLYKKYKFIIENDKIDNSLEQNKSNKVWICWFQGYDQAPELVRTVISSIRKNMPEKEIIILNDDNISQYAKFPKSIIEKRKEGKISAAHYSDLLRVELLCRYGGMWIDATVLCTSNNIPEYISETPLFVYKAMDLTGLDLEPTNCSSWFISAQSNNPILLLTRRLLWQYWEDFNILQDYFLFHIFLTMSARKYSELWDEIPLFNNVSPHVLQSELLNVYTEERWNQIKSISIFHKLNHHKVFSNEGDTFYNHIVSEYLDEDKK